MNKLDISLSPHIHSGDTVLKKMQHVIVALMPAYIVGLYYFGLGAMIVSLISITACVSIEYLIQRFLTKGENTVTDGSAVLTGLLLAMNLPSNLPIWMILLGSLVAIGIGKMSYGGLGNNIFNPALVGRVFLLISFPLAMNSWPIPQALNTAYLDAHTAATSLATLKGQFVNMPTLMDMLVGNKGGSMGEVSALALMLGGIYLVFKRILTWHIPVSILVTVVLFTGILHTLNSDVYAATPLFHFLNGGLLLGAIFMATDYATSPMSGNGKLIYGVGIGIITVIIRIFGAYPEGISFAILMMNACTPLINHYIKPKRFSKVTQ